MVSATIQFSALLEQETNGDIISELRDVPLQFHRTLCLETKISSLPLILRDAVVQACSSNLRKHKQLRPFFDEIIDSVHSLLEKATYNLEWKMVEISSEKSLSELIPPDQESLKLNVILHNLNPASLTCLKNMVFTIPHGQKHQILPVNSVPSVSESTSSCGVSATDFDTQLVDKISFSHTNLMEEVLNGSEFNEYFTQHYFEAQEVTGAYTPGEQTSAFTEQEDLLTTDTDGASVVSNFPLDYAVSPNSEAFASTFVEFFESCGLQLRDDITEKNALDGDTGGAEEADMQESLEPISSSESGELSPLTRESRITQVYSDTMSSDDELYCTGLGKSRDCVEAMKRNFIRDLVGSDDEIEEIMEESEVLPLACFNDVLRKGFVHQETSFYIPHLFQIHFNPKSCLKDANQSDFIVREYKSVFPYGTKSPNTVSSKFKTMLNHFKRSVEQLYVFEGVVRAAKLKFATEFETQANLLNNCVK
ncbi:hypothetical protein HDU83_002109 [Entophlyctis luteolus]|nr:hypothetical protein HDU83_002109 [Entophlyctis luteolus]